MLLSLALCHILPEANEMYGIYQKGLEAKEEGVVKMAHDHEEEGHEEEGHEEEGHEEEGHEEEGHEEEGHEEEGHEEEGHEEEGHEEHAGHKEEGEHSFPVPSVLFFCGFIVMIILDQVIFKPNKNVFKKDTSKQS